MDWATSLFFVFLYCTFNLQFASEICLYLYGRENRNKKAGKCNEYITNHC
jgi:hypothetical protein